MAEINMPVITTFSYVCIFTYIRAYNIYKQYVQYMINIYIYILYSIFLYIVYIFIYAMPLVAYAHYRMKRN